MREFKISAGTVPRYIRALIAGAASSGKTSFVATAPRPLIIADETEGGYKTLYEIDPSLRWDPRVEPEVWSIESIKDVGPLLVRLEKAAASGNFPWGTVAFDPISIYSDRVLFELGQDGKKSDGTQMDGRALYGDLATHLQMLIRRMHALPAHILWCSHVKPGADDGLIAIGGQMADKFPAFCDFKWYTNVTTMPGRPPAFELRTQPFRSWKFLGCRYGHLPDPLIPSFKVVAQILRLPEKPASPSVPGYPNGVIYGEPQPPPPVQQQQAPSGAAGAPRTR
jgi:hypothetical protein